MSDPFRGEVCAAWLDYLSELDPEVLQQVMELVCNAEVWEGRARADEAEAVQRRTAEVYLDDLSYANARANHPALRRPTHVLTDDQVQHLIREHRDITGVL